LPCRDPERQREHARRHYEKNREAMIARAREHTKRKRIELRAWVRDYLLSHPCVDCGEADPVVLEFDHRDPATKDENIADAISRRGWGLPRLQAEAEKCDVRCCNCHRRRTVAERHWLLGGNDDFFLAREEPASVQLEIARVCGNSVGTEAMA
jgi:hypothetical protein